jgi:alpha-amylase
MGRGTIDLLMAVHSHQPEGNFEWVFAEAYEKSYLPFLDLLYRHPQLKASLHYSGCLLDWIAGKHPEFIKMLREMVGRGQVEMLGGGYYEPILSLIPERDILGQIKLMNEKLKAFTGKPAAGIWLTERVWSRRL